MLRPQSRSPLAANKRSRARRPPCPRRVRPRPGVEALEDRSLLSLFAAPLTFAIGPLTGSPIVADFNGDGRPDLAAISTVPYGTHGTNTAYVLLRTASGTFAPAVTSPAGGLIGGMAVGDLDGDGRADLALGDNVLRTYIDGQPALHLLWSNGDGTFTTDPHAYSISAPGGPFGASMLVQAADFNGDGRPDLVLFNTGAGASMVLLNQGNRTFTSTARFTVGPSGTAGGLTVGDFNGDGRPDLAFTTTSAGSTTPDGIAVLLGNGDGTFAPPIYSTVGAAASGSPTVADLDGDGRSDLAVLNSDGNTVSVLLSKGDGAFTAPVSYATGTHPTQPAVADLNGDGKPDLAVANSNNNTVSVLLNRGDGTFAPAVSYATGTYPDGLVVADFNGDGKPDLAVANRDDDTVSVLLRKGDGTFLPAVSYAAGSRPGGPGVADFNGDGRPDLAVGNNAQRADGGISVLMNTSRHGPSTPAVFDPGSGTWYLRNSNASGAPDVGPFPYGAAGWLPVVGDWNGDGTTTIGVVDPGTAVWYLRNENSPGAPDVAAPFAYGLPGWVPVVGDWTGSGHTGIGMFDPSTGTWYLRNEDNAGPPDTGVFRYGAPGWIPVVGDWNGDGKTTIGVVDPGSMTWYLRNSNSAGAPDVTPFAYGGIGWKPVAGDWTGTGPTTVGVVDPRGAWYLRNRNSAGAPDVTPFAYGLGGWAPLAGTWTRPGQALSAGTGRSNDLTADLLAPDVRRTEARDAAFARGL